MRNRILNEILLMTKDIVVSTVTQVFYSTIEYLKETEKGNENN